MAQLVGVADGEGGRVVDHEHRDRAHRHDLTCHGDHAGGTGGDPVNMDADVAWVVDEHVVALGCRDDVSAGAVDPHRDIS